MTVNCPVKDQREFKGDFLLAPYKFLQIVRFKIFSKLAYIGLKLWDLGELQLQRLKNRAPSDKGILIAHPREPGSDD